MATTTYENTVITFNKVINSNTVPNFNSIFQPTPPDEANNLKYQYPFYIL